MEILSKFKSLPKNPTIRLNQLDQVRYHILQPSPNGMLIPGGCPSKWLSGIDLSKSPVTGVYCKNIKCFECPFRQETNSLIERFLKMTAFRGNMALAFVANQASSMEPDEGFRQDVVFSKFVNGVPVKTTVSLAHFENPIKGYYEFNINSKVRKKDEEKKC